VGQPRVNKCRRFDPCPAHFFRRCANLGCGEVVAGQDLGSAVDAELGDELTDQGFGFLGLTVEEAFELVGEGGEVRGCGAVCALLWVFEGEFGVLGVEVVEPGLEAGEAGFAAFGGELAVFEGLVVALQGLFVSADLSLDGGEPLVDFWLSLLGLVR